MFFSNTETALALLHRTRARQGCRINVLKADAPWHEGNPRCCQCPRNLGLPLSLEDIQQHAHLMKILPRYSLQSLHSTRAQSNNIKKITFWSKILACAHFFWCHIQLGIGPNVILNNCHIIPRAVRAELWPFLPRCLKRRHYLFVLSFHSPNKFNLLLLENETRCKVLGRVQNADLAVVVFLPVVWVQTHWSRGCFLKEDVSQEQLWSPALQLFHFSHLNSSL